jgi:hypothetical protein
MLPTEDLFVYVYVLVDDAISSGAAAIALRPGPAPACTDAELLAVALVRHLLGRRSEAGFLAEVARDWAHLFPADRASLALTLRSSPNGGFDMGDAPGPQDLSHFPVVLPDLPPGARAVPVHGWDGVLRPARLPEPAPSQAPSDAIRGGAALAAA